MITMVPYRIPLLPFVLLALLPSLPRSSAESDSSSLKYFFFCGSSFADIQADTCSDRQWCPSSSDDECTVPGHTCFANTPCDAREIGGVQVPTYSLSLQPEYRNATDKMFCGVDYSDAIATCEAGGEEAIARHCPEMNCPDGQTCFIDMPCSYFVLTNPIASPLSNVNELEAEEVELPDPGSPESQYFCGTTFEQAASSCSSSTWCRTGTSQECPNGETCFVDVSSVNPDCEINAIKKTEFETSQSNSRSPNIVPTPKPSNSPLASNDPKNRKFCGTSWQEASSNCDLERFCPNGDDDCPTGMTCFDYTPCDTIELTYAPTATVTLPPSGEPSLRPINTSPTEYPTTSKPSREPSPEPSATPVIKPTLPPSIPPSHAPLPYGDFRLEFWCGLSYFDAMENCASRCPSGSDDECPGELICLSGVTDCKNEMGMSAYMTKEVEAGNETMVDSEMSNSTSSAEPSRTPTPSLSSSGEPLNSQGPSAELAKLSASPSAGLEKLLESASPVALEEAVTAAEEDTNELQGPFEEEMVRIILYGLDSDSVLADGNTTLNSWKTLTRKYIMDFFNKYPTQEMLDKGDTRSDEIRASLYDVTVVITDEEIDEAPPHDYTPILEGEISVENNRRHLRRSAIGSKGNVNHPSSAIRRTQTGIDPSKTVMITYAQSSTYRSPPDLVIEDPSIVMRLPLETAEYRADYVNYLRARDYGAFQNLEYASQFLYTEFPTAAPTGIVTPKPTGSPVVPGEPTVAPTLSPTEDFGCNLCKPRQYGVDAEVMFNGEASTCMEVYNWFLTNHRQGSGKCKEGQSQLNELCCRDEEEEPQDASATESEPTDEVQEPQDVSATETEPTLSPIAPNRPSFKPSEVLEIPTDELGLPDAASLAETYYCGSDWDSIDSNCDDATPCPSGVSSDCPDGEQCIAFTNCGGKFVFVSDPDVDGGGPNADNVKSTFYCGTSVQFLENNCEGATPCPNGPEDCEGDGQQFGCFAFTGCNEQVDPGSFVGFLKPPDENSMNSDIDSSSTFFCAETWDELNSNCVDGIPDGFTPCPSGDILECGDGEGCFAYACNTGAEVAAVPAPSPSSEYSVEDLDLLKSTFFCGTSVEEIDKDCENATPCPSGDECPEGFGCFAFSQCGGVDISSLVDTFGDTDRPTRAPTVPIEQICDEDMKMSVNVGYWQSWSIYREDDCQPMSTSSFDAAPYTHVVYSFASIDSTYRMEAWNGTYENEVPLYKEFNTLKQRHSGAKTMIAVGGWTHNDPGPMQNRFSRMAASAINRVTFANSVVEFMRTYGFDGLDIDWEYPGLRDRGGKRADYDNFVLMVKELRDAFNAAPEPYELSVAIPGNITKLEMGFDLAGLAEHVDWFNLMSYDLWGSWDPKKIAKSHTDFRMIDEAVEYISHFIQRSQLVLGLGSYARTYEMEDEDCSDLECPFVGPGKAGCEGTDGFMPYFEIADIVTSRTYDSLRYDDDSESIVMVTDGNRLISYDNTVSFNRKIQYAEEMCLMGKMLWAIDMLKDGSNPLSSNSGNSNLTGDPSDQSFCGTDFQDVINGCKQPCPSGDSSQCPPGQQCFANTGCSIDNVGSPPPTMCRLCTDPSTQGMKDWLELEFEGETMTCADADMTVISAYAKGSEECDSAKQSAASTCCYNYPANPCMLCRSETEFMDLRANAEIEFDGMNMTCFDLSKRLGPEENDGRMCMDAQKEHFDQCCYNQCTLCEGQGVKWWNEVEYEDKPLNCGELDAQLYANETEVGEEMCTDVLSEYSGECCYDYPTDPCDICTKNGKKHALIPNEEVEYEGSNFTCAEVNNFLSPFESSSSQCSEVIDLAFDACCFDRCSLCGVGARLDADVLVDIDGEQGSCASIESDLFQNQTTDGSEECTEARTLHYDSCCFEIPATPCQLCGTEEYLHHTTTVMFNDEEVTCRSASNFLQEREDATSKTCSNAKAELGETCCYSICNICGDNDLDWDVFVNYDGKDMSCGDFNEIFREEAIQDGAEQCDALKAEYSSTCCYSSPTTSCQLCKHDGIYYDIKDQVEVDFNGPTTCLEVANFLSRRTEDTDPACAVTQTSLFGECCYEKCNIAQPGTYPDWTAEVEMDGKVATCLELEDAIMDASIPNNSTECKSLQDAFSSTCSYSTPSNACDICPDRAVSMNATAQWDGKEMKCSDIHNRLSTREEAEGEVCVDAQTSLQDVCCFDQCMVCDKSSQKTDPVLTVYHNGKTKQCTEVDTYFYEMSILASSDECKTSIPDLSQCCYTEPTNPCTICRKDLKDFDVMGSNSVTYQNQKMTCAEVSDMMFRREEESGDTCSSAKADLFDSCCDSKCSICGDKGLEAGVKISFEGRTMTCLELDMGLGPAAITAGSDQCNDITSKFSEDCCYDKPETPCRICAGDNVGVSKDVSVNYLGTETTCESLSNYLGGREEQESETCVSATEDHSQDCCFDLCSLCGEGKADWETFVTFEGQSIACGDFEWILREQTVVAGSDKCSAVKDEFSEKCCYDPPESSCNLCHVDMNYLEVSPDVQISYQGSQMNCLSLYNSLFVREADGSDQCQAAKDEFASSCCFEKCTMCTVGILDVSAVVNVTGLETSCSALDLSFSKDIVVEGSAICNEKRSEYAGTCCYTLPTNPCRVCPAGSDVNGDVLVDFYGEEKTCGDVGNRLAISEEEGSESCLSTQLDFSQECCFEKCLICPEGYNLNWEVDVEYNMATIACGEFDTVIRDNAIQNGAQECSSLQSIYTSACCYNYATASGVGYSTVTNMTQVITTGSLTTNLDTSNLTQSQIEDTKQVFQNLITNTLESEGVLPIDSKVTVTNIDDEGVVQYEIEMQIDDIEKSDAVGVGTGAVSGSEAGSGIGFPSGSGGGSGSETDVFVAKIESVLNNTATLQEISEDLKTEAANSSVAEELAASNLTSFVQGETSTTNVSSEETNMTPVITTGSLVTNLDTSNLTQSQIEDAKQVFQNLIKNTLESEDVLPIDSNVTVTGIDDKGVVEYEIEAQIEDVKESDAVEVGTGSGVATGAGSASGSGMISGTGSGGETDVIVAKIESVLNNTATLQEISGDLKTEAANSSVAKELAAVNLTNFVQGETSTTSFGSATTGAGPCNLCKDTEIGLDLEILFNGAQTTCPEVYKFLATQAEAGSDACVAGQEALHDDCCLKKCDLCSGGGIPDWYGMVTVNGKSMTCLELDGVVTESQIQSGSEQCSQLLKIAAPACCYEPPTTPCNMCDNGSKSEDVMISTNVDYGGTTSTCGQIFNTLFSREETNSDTCTLARQDLASQCCYNKCSLCGDLQTNSALTVTHDGAQLGCGEFDSYIFASNLIKEGSAECSSFQSEHRQACCYDIQCSLCAKGDEIYTTQEDAVVQYGGLEATCGEVANFLYEQEMSQSNNCLAAQENIFNDCCFQQCEMCETGTSVNWAATTTFNGKSQSCTDVYLLLSSEGIASSSETCGSISDVSKDCCYTIPNEQCSLCKDSSGATYNTRWNTQVTVNGMTKTCGDFNTLLATQEKDSQTCAMAKDAIFNDCCFAGSETLVAIANQMTTETDAPCSLCKPGQVGIYAEVTFNNQQRTCLEVYNFLINGYKEISTTCKSAQVWLSVDCCKEPGQLSSSEVPAFMGTTNTTEVLDGEGSVAAEESKPKGKVITPPLEFEFDTWTRMPNGAHDCISLSTLCMLVVGFVTLAYLC